MNVELRDEAAGFEYHRLDLWIVVLRGYGGGVPA